MGTCIPSCNATPAEDSLFLIPRRRIKKKGKIRRRRRVDEFNKDFVDLF